MATGFTKKVNMSLMNMPNDLDLVGTIKKWTGATAPTGWMLTDGSAVSRTTYAELFALMPYLSQTVTMTQASPCVVTMTAHGLQTGQQVQFSTTGNLYTGLAVGTVYFIRWVSVDTFHLYDTEAHAVNTAATTGVINTSSTQSGVHTGIAYKWGNGNGSTTFNIPDFRGASVAGVGTSGNGYLAAETFVLGAKYNDTMQGHYHELRGNANDESRGAGSYSTNGIVNLVGNNFVQNPTADASNGTPRTGTVTRGKVVGVNFIIKAYNVLKTVYAQGVDGARLSIDSTFATNSDSLVPSEKAVKTLTSHPLTAGKTDDYANTDTDGLQRIEYDTTTKACAHTLPLIANNYGRRIEVALVKQDASLDVVTISPHASNPNTISGDALASIILAKAGDFAIFQASTITGMWEIVSASISSQLRLQQYAGYGGTDTRIPYFTNTLENIGNCHTLTTNNNTNGCKVTINRSGRYACNFSYNSPAAAATIFGISLNSTQLITSIISITATDRLCASNPVAADEAQSVSATLRFNKGDVIRPHVHVNTAPASTAVCSFSVTYLGQ